MPSQKRRLTKQEVEFVRKWMEGTSQDRKPTIRQIARYFKVNRPSVIKSLGGWEGIQRNRPQPEPKPLFKSNLDLTPVELERFTVKVPKGFKP